MSSKAELFIEFTTEEIPARMQENAQALFKKLLCEGLKSRALSFSKLETYITPRRLVAYAEGVPCQQDDFTEEKRGPRVGAPEAAIQGFLKGAGLSSLEDCFQKEDPKGAFWMLRRTVKGQQTKALLNDIVGQILRHFTWEKSMRWGNNSFYWVRPLRRITCVFKGETVPGSFDLGHDTLDFSNKSQGHPLGDATPFEVTSFQDYEAKLKTKGVLLRPQDREAAIKSRIQYLLEQKDLRLVQDAGLMKEVVGLTEWPVPILGDIDPAFMSLPRELLTTVMRVHQRYFAVEDTHGNLAPFFISVANISPKDDGQQIAHGTGQVLKARLADARFFYDTDLKQTLDEHGKGLAKRRVHEKLGSFADKSDRLQALSQKIGPALDLDPSLCAKVAALCKADLTTGMVGEFPTLQGVMGKYYARAQGLAHDQAQAIEDHYKPAGPQDPLPKTSFGTVVALADKIDTLVGFFAQNIKPTGSKDPFALRRAALGCIRLLEKTADLSLSELITASYNTYHSSGIPLECTEKETCDALETFFNDRLTVFWRDRGFPHDYVSAICTHVLDTPLQALALRLEALSSYLKSDQGEQLLRGYRRVSKILASDKNIKVPNLETHLFEETAEKELHHKLDQIQSPLQKGLTEKRYQDALQALSTLEEPLNTFFDQVHVYDEDPALRNNRIALLAWAQKSFHQMANFSKIEG